ncbi:MAG: hypothetical protein JEY71_03710 [Sphaerochaeta sp.]|nr:hypothetical protein [Sphaerochaeta sp.]
MKGINTPGQALERGGVASFSAPRGSRISPCFPGTRSVMVSNNSYLFHTSFILSSCIWG